MLICFVYYYVHEVFNAIKGGSESSSLCHQRQGHLNLKSLRVLEESNNITISQWFDKPSICDSCQIGKCCKLPFNISNKISHFPFDKIYCDL